MSFTNNRVARSYENRSTFILSMGSDKEGYELRMSIIWISIIRLDSVSLLRSRTMCFLLSNVQMSFVKGSFYGQYDPVTSPVVGSDPSDECWTRSGRHEYEPK